MNGRLVENQVPQEADEEQCYVTEVSTLPSPGREEYF